LGAAGIGEFTGDSMRRSAVERQFEVLGDVLDRVRRADSETSRRIPDLARIMGLWADLLGLKEPDPTIRLFAPAQVDFGRRMRIASKVFIDRNFTAMSIGGITIGEGVVDVLGRLYAHRIGEGGEIAQDGVADLGLVLDDDNGELHG